MLLRPPASRLPHLRRSLAWHSAAAPAALALLCAILLAASVPASAPAASSAAARPLQADSSHPVVVQPGAPGQPSKTLSPSTHATLLPPTHADIAFMQGMIMHHAQAVEMTALIPSHTDNKDLHTLGARISISQSDEIKFMKRWLASRGQPTSMPMPDMSSADANPNADAPASAHTMLMPGMLTPAQMDALRKATGADFDRLFLTGMIQHHGGALIMVKDLFDTPGAGQDAELFNFATDVDSGQRAEIRIMHAMLDKESPAAKPSADNSSAEKPSAGKSSVGKSPTNKSGEKQ